LLVGWYSGTWRDVVSLWQENGASQPPVVEKKSNNDQTEDRTWDDLEQWLQSDAPADFDSLGNRVVAQRIAAYLKTGTRSVGIVGPYGAGKTSIVNWVTEQVETPDRDSSRCFVCRHSCWGFETSASAIQQMLAAAVSRVGAEIDTFQVKSLPDTYRQTFTAGNEWFRSVSDLVAPRRDPIEQFEQLSSLLGELDARLVIVVEDLDRSETRAFEIQEVLALLERLKQHVNLSFVLTGGHSASREIDFGKLCDQFEYLKAIQPRVSSSFVQQLVDRCLDTTIFRCEHVGDSDQRHDWNVLSGMMMRDTEEFSLPGAVAELLSTPRALRHALGRTYCSWKDLHGEINLHHLLALNVLRFGAPECFEFLWRRWDRIHAPPSRTLSMGQEHVDHIRDAVLQDWSKTIQDVDWNPAAALRVVKYLWPSTEYWLAGGTSPGYLPSAPPQGVQDEKYWRRAVNGAIDSDGVLDQSVIQDMRQWMTSPSLDSNVVRLLTSSPAYCDVWEDLLGTGFDIDPDLILLLCTHVLDSIMAKHGAAASDESLGFANTWRIVNRRVPLRPENKEWLESRISRASSNSIKLVFDLWDYFGERGQFSVLDQGDDIAVRRHLTEALRASLPDGDAVIRVFDKKYSYVLYQLVRDPGRQDMNDASELQAWIWLGPVLLDALRQRNETVAAAVAILLASGDPDHRSHPATVDPKMLLAFFPNDILEVADLLVALSDDVEDADQKRIVSSVAESARVFNANNVSQPKVASTESP
jgi:hypothetical protein